MDLNKTIMAGIYVIVGIYFLYRLFLKKDHHQQEYERLYKEITNSDKYKAKGQWSKEE